MSVCVYFNCVYIFVSVRVRVVMPALQLSSKTLLYLAHCLSYDRLSDLNTHLKGVRGQLSFTFAISVRPWFPILIFFKDHFISELWF